MGLGLTVCGLFARRSFIQAQVRRGRSVGLLTNLSGMIIFYDENLHKAPLVLSVVWYCVVAFSMNLIAL